MNLWSESLSEALIDFILHNNLKETHSYAFKKPQDYSFNTSPNFDKLSKSVSAMANADGGILFIGIKTLRSKAANTEPVTNEPISAETIRFQLAHHIFPVIDDLTVEECRVEGGKVFAIKVPNAGNAPFMAADKRYYKRVETKELLLEEYEIRTMYRLNKHAELELFGVLNTQGIPLIEGGKYVKVNFYPKFLVKNVSEVIERDYKVELYIPSALHNPNFTVLQNYFNRLEDQYNVFQVVGKDSLFQQELSAVMEANIFVNMDNYDIFAEDEIRIKLFYSQGVKIKNFRLIDLFLYQNQQLHKTDFLDNHILSK